MERNYPAKLLLFGEYSIISNSLALAVPYQQYIGKWEKTSASKNIERAHSSSQSLRSIYAYLVELAANFSSKSVLDLEKMKADLDAGAWFDSSIPTGYGLGSSGAVCAAIYDGYCHNKSEDLLTLKSQLSQLEGCFHGTSSGIDPLVCYLQQAILIKENQEIAILPDFNPNNKAGKGAIFLIDTHIARQTTPLVQHYLQLAQAASFQNQFILPSKQLVSEAIEALLEQKPSLHHIVKEISALQYEYMQQMIPAAYQMLWKEGLRTGHYSLKLCGAGGGGFILGFTEDWKACEQHIAAARLLYSF